MEYNNNIIDSQIGGGSLSSSSFGYVKCNLPIWLLNIGIIYVITTVCYFFMNYMKEDPVLEILEPFPKLLEHYRKTKKYSTRNLLLGVFIGCSTVFFLKPFGGLF